MKKTSIQKKLILNKETISSLSKNEMDELKGGLSGFICDATVGITKEIIKEITNNSIGYICANGE